MAFGKPLLMRFRSIGVTLDFHGINVAVFVRALGTKARNPIVPDLVSDI
jgi:hypothetical protein